ncbi:MAG: hypothetical protein ACFBZ9_10945 [Sphingomonadales bacterium]
MLQGSQERLASLILSTAFFNEALAELNETISNPVGSQARPCAGRPGRLIGDVSAADYREIWKMVDLEEKTSNHLFDILSEWNDQLSHCSYYQNFETLPFQEFDALPQISADCAANEGETPAEKTAGEADGGGSCQS